jgi:hypothetical protein
MHLATASLLLPVLLAALPATAGDNTIGGSATGDGATALDLGLPQQKLFTGAPAYQDDPPGTYYGDTTGDPAPVPRIEPACPTAPDGSERSMTGSFTTGIGYSSRGGNSNFNAANLNFCKGYADDDGNVRTLNLNINVEKYDGPGGYYGDYYGGYGRGGGWGMGAPHR